MTSPERTRPVQERGRQAARRIPVAAESILDIQGYAEFSMASLSISSGLSIGGMNAHFTNKEARLRRGKSDVPAKPESKREGRLRKSSDPVGCEGFPSHDTDEKELTVMSIGYLNHWAGRSLQPQTISTTEPLFQSTLRGHDAEPYKPLPH